MTACVRLAMIGALLLALEGAVYGELSGAGKNELTIRGHRQKIDFYPADSPGQHLRILFAPGDAGCRGFAVTITEELAKSGYDAFCLDTRHYLESFTGKQMLSTKEIASDFSEIARWVQQGKRERIL